MNLKIKSLLSELPDKPGVYKFINKDGLLLYVGKAKSLKKRVKSYFSKKQGVPVRTEKLIESIFDIEWIVVSSEWEALQLETNLIKEFQPKYNVLMKDDKNFVYIKITRNEDYPRIKIVRKIEKDKCRYFGPKTSAHDVKRTLTLLQKIFMFRSCDLGIAWKNDGFVNITRKSIAFPCLDFHIKRCSGPCIANISPDEYLKSILQIEMFLEGRTQSIESALNLEIQECVKNKAFEKAALIRDRLKSISDLQLKQIVTIPKDKNSDVISFVLDRGKAYFNLFIVRGGKLINSENFILESSGFEKGDEQFANEILESFLFQYYQITSDIPAEIIIPIAIDSEPLFQEFIKKNFDNRVVLTVPLRGENMELLNLGKKNADSFFKQHKARFEFTTRDDLEALVEIKEKLGLKSNPKRIECYDISHLSGTDTVASMVVFEDGKPKSSDYRKFRLKTLMEGEINDFKSMEETLFRRLSKISLGPESITVSKAKKSEITEITSILDQMNLNVDFDVNMHIFSAHINDKFVGFLLIESFRSEIHMFRVLFVREEFRHRGVASKLIKCALKKIKSKRFYIACLSDVAPLYEKNGFEDVKILPNSLGERLASFKKLNKDKTISLLAFDPKKSFDPSFSSTPDLILIDGGKGQLNSVLKIIDELGLSKIPVISLAKKFEEVFIPKVTKPIIFKNDSQGLNLLRRVRDEAHRFAISFQKDSRKKYLISSELDKIPGVGKTIKTNLLKRFGSVEQIKQSNLEEISELTGPALARTILEHLNL